MEKGGLKLKIVGAVGQIGSGKDTIVKYISDKCSMPIISIGDIAREIAKHEGLPATRENLQKITEKYYAQFGRTYFIEETIRRIQHAKHDKILITGIRAPTDITTLRNHFHEDFILISVTANKKNRFQRLLTRGEPRDPKAWQEFLKQDREEEKIFQIAKSCKLADYSIENNGTVEKLFQKVDKIITERLSNH
jgi:dephospho-CoA kinase